MLRTFFVLFLIILGAHRSHRALLAAVAQQTRGTATDAATDPGSSSKPDTDQRQPIIADILPSSAALKFLSLGYKNLVADYFWLRSVSDYGNKQMVHANYPNLWPLLSRAHELDRQFAAPYIFAGNVMTLHGMSWQPALVMLEEGTHVRADLWRIAFLYGFNLFYLEQNFEKAAQALAQAASHADAPPFVGPLAARLAAEAGAAEVGLTMVDALIAETADQSLIDILTDRRRRLLLEIDLKVLNQAATACRAAHHMPPRRLEDLLGCNGLQSLPPDPLGGAYYLDSNGRVQTHHDDQRLRLSDKIKEDSRGSH